MTDCYICGCNDKYYGNGFCKYHFFTINKLDNQDRYKNYERKSYSLDIKRRYNNPYYQKLRREVLKKLGNKCIQCGFSDWRALQIDHVNGGGTKEKKEIKRTYHLFVLEEIKKGSNKYQLLCANCNWIKRYENNEVFKKKV